MGVLIGLASGSAHTASRELGINVRRERLRWV